MGRQLLVRDVDEEIVTALQQRVAANGRSAEAEHRLILERELRGPKRIPPAEALLKIPTAGNDEDFERR